MVKVAGTVAVVFAVGAGAVTMFGSVLGGVAEAATLGMIGAGLVAAGHLVSSKVGANRHATGGVPGRQVSETA